LDQKQAYLNMLGSAIARFASTADGCAKEVKYHKGYFKDGKWIGNYGWSVVIVHPGGYQSRYAHLKDEPLVPMMSYDPNHY